MLGKSRNMMFFQWIVAREGRKVGWLKRRVRSHVARWEMKNCTRRWREAHFQVARELLLQKKRFSSDEFHGFHWSLLGKIFKGFCQDPGMIQWCNFWGPKKSQLWNGCIHYQESGFCFGFGGFPSYPSNKTIRKFEGGFFCKQSTSRKSRQFRSMCSRVSLFFLLFKGRGFGSTFFGLLSFPGFPAESPVYMVSHPFLLELLHRPASKS